MSIERDQLSEKAEQSTDFVDRFLGLSSTWKFLVSIALLLLVYLVASDLIWPTSEKWAQESEELEQLLQESRSMESKIDRKLEWVVASLGPIEVPRSPNPGADRLEATVNDIVSGRKVQNYTFETRPGARVQASSALRNIAGGGRVERVHAEVEFQASPEDAIDLVRELEAEPEIESIGSIRMTADPDLRLVEVKLVVEAWIKAPDRRRPS